MRFWRSIGLAALALATLTLPARAQDGAAAAKPPTTPGSSVPERRAWMIGFHYGYAGTRFVGSDRDVVAELRSDAGSEFPPLVVGKPDWSGTDIETGAAIQFRVGYAMNPRWAFGFERSQWSKDFDTYKWSFTMSALTATYYPGAGHFFVRGGAGITTVIEKLPPFFPASGVGRTTLAPHLVFTDPFFVQYQDHGFGLDLAAGYEWPLYRRVSIAPEIAVRSMTFADGIRSQEGSGSVALNWWF